MLDCDWSSDVCSSDLALPCFVLDPLECVERADHKPLQLRVAQQVGLEVPRTLATNDPAAARAFARECRHGVVAKPALPVAIHGDEADTVHVVYANVLRDEDLDALDGLRYAPMIFQERVARAVELRCVVVGRRVFAASIEFDASARDSVDWRRSALDTLDAWRPYDLSPAVAARLIAMLDRFGLNYGAFDLIATPDGRHVFLEVNPCGQFAWLDFYAGLPIVDAVADTLVGTNRRIE
jgi:glutathione synthase/RimK-type ligase-like ATP-grasp enzyme